MKYALMAACLCSVLFSANKGVGQTISPPIAEYRGKAQGMFELRNDGDVPLAAIVEVHGFSVDQEGNLKYEDLDPATRVEIGANSFVIPAHQTHMVFYKASSSKPSAWFAILSTLTRAASDRNTFRVNFVLPHVVYAYQKQKLKKDDVAITVLPGSNSGEYRVEVKNRSEKLGRIQNVSASGFEKDGQHGGFPLFPAAIRNITLTPGAAKADASIKIAFEDGFTVQVPVR